MLEKAKKKADKRSKVKGEVRVDGKDDGEAGEEFAALDGLKRPEPVPVALKQFQLRMHGTQETFDAFLSEIKLTRCGGARRKGW